MTPDLERARASSAGEPIHLRLVPAGAPARVPRSGAATPAAGGVRPLRGPVDSTGYSGRSGANVELPRSRRLGVLAESVVVRPRRGEAQHDAQPPPPGRRPAATRGRPMKAVIYAAKSTEDTHGSIPTQLEDGRALAKGQGWEVVGPGSASRTQRARCSTKARATTTRRSAPTRGTAGLGSPPRSRPRSRTRPACSSPRTPIASRAAPATLPARGPQRHALAAQREVQLAE